MCITLSLITNNIHKYWKYKKSHVGIILSEFICEKAAYSRLCNHRLQMSNSQLQISNAKLQNYTGGCNAGLRNPELQ